MSDIDKPYFQDAEKAREYLESVRWPDGPVCPHCGGCEKIYPLKGKSHRPGLYKCGDCKEQFTVTVGTVMEKSKIPIHKWLLASYLLCSSKKGISSHQLHRMLGLTYKSAWFLTHRIREAMRDPGKSGDMGGGGSKVEVDETFWGNKKPRDQKKGRGYHHKEKVLTLVERKGRARSFHVPRVNAETLRPILREQIKQDTHVITDEAGQYCLTKIPMAAEFQAHDFVKHNIGEYVRGDIHTNTIENYFSILKRGLTGTYQHVSPKHLKRYLGEFDFRYNYRETVDKETKKKTGYSDAERTKMALKGIAGKRLTYRPLSSGA